MKKLVFMALVCTSLALSACTSAPAPDAPADTIYVNGKIITVDKDFSYAEAVAVKDGRILAVGKDSDIQPYKGGETAVVDLDGKTVIPGMMDTHLHFQRYGLRFLQIDAMDKSKEWILQELADKTDQLDNPELWIRGGGWNQETWASPVFPTKEDLDAVTTNPVALVRSDNHTLWVNSKALEIAGITRYTSDPAGGVIHRDSTGEPTGILVDSAMDLVNNKIPAWSREEIKMAYLNADKIYSSVGLTTVADAADDTDIPLQKEMISAGEIKTRIYAMLDKKTADVWFQEGRKPEIGLYDEHMTIRALKLKADGALGSRGAKLLADYSDAAGVTGNTLITKDELLEYQKRADELGWQLHLHAIGDKTNRDVLDVIEASIAGGKNPDNERRHSVVHAQTISMNDIPRYGMLNVPALMQPVHATGDMNMAETRIGPWRILGAYAWNTLLKQGVLIAGGSDSPNDYIEPIYGIHALVTRQNKDSLPIGGWYPQECLTVEEAIKVYTINPAFVFFQEDIKGSIEPGKLADFVILSEDITQIPPEDIFRVRVLKTIVGDKVVYETEALTDL